MIITQTPLRIGLLGGGTDLPSYYLEHGGRVLNCAIDKYIYVIVKQRFDDEIYVNYSKKEIVSRVADIEHELVREAMLMTGVTGGVEITTLADIPSSGSGLGSSSAVTVGLLHALYAYTGRQVSAEELAEGACRIEIERCGKPIGKQDQYIAAFGGVMVFEFNPDDTVTARPVRASADTLDLLPVTGADSQWYKNVLVSPTVRIVADGAEYAAPATPITDPAKVAEVIDAFRAKYGADNVRNYYPNPNVAVEVPLA